MRKRLCGRLVTIDTENMSACLIIMPAHEPAHENTMLLNPSFFQCMGCNTVYNNASEVIREALRIAHRQEQENDWLKREAAIGYAQLEAGERTRVKSKEEFKILVRGGNNPDDD